MRLLNVCKYIWVAFWVIWMLWAPWMKPAAKRASPAAHLLYTTLAVAGFFLMFWENPIRWLRLRVLPGDLWVQELGVAITLAGIGVAIWARSYLGRNWSSAVTVKVGHELVRSGPYRFVRHPIYSGLLLALVGTALVRGTVCGFVALALVYAAWKIKSSLEERMMIATFGAEYLEYARTTGAILPRLR